MEPAKKRKQERINVRFGAEDRKTLQEIAKLCGMSLTDLIRLRVLLMTTKEIQSIGGNK